jgi:Tol biopolymer transport system component
MIKNSSGRKILLKGAIMKIINREAKINRTVLNINIIRCLVILLVIPLLGISGFEKGGVKDSTKDPARGYGIVSPTLTPDNKKIILGVYHKGKCDLASYEIASGKMNRFNATGHQYDDGAPIYSRDGKMFVFASGKDYDQNIFIMNANGTGLKQVTHNDNKNPAQGNGNVVIKLNSSPSFSTDNKRIIFIRSGIKRQRSTGGEMLSNWDVWEYDIATGIEIKLTDYKYYAIGRPFYLPDGRRFIFSGDGPKNNSGKAPKNFSEYEAMFKNNMIFIMDGVKNDLKPVLQYGDWTSDPSIDKHGSILFIARTNHLDGSGGRYTYDLFLKKGKEIKRVTSKRFSRIVEPFLSFDGSKAVFLASREIGAGPSLFIVNSDGTGLKYFELPSWEEIEVVKQLQ